MHATESTMMMIATSDAAAPSMSPTDIGARLVRVSRQLAVAKTAETYAKTMSVALDLVTPHAERTVSLAISPPNATVEVDGTKRDMIDGVVQIKGVLGGVVSVRVTSSAGETTQSVAITEGGAIPPKIALAPKGSAGSGASAVAGGGTGPRIGGGKPAGTGAAGGKPTPSATGTTLNAQRNFE